MFKILLPLAFILTLGVFAPTPDPAITTGALCTQSNPDFDGLRYPEKIAHCRRDVSGYLKHDIYMLYGIPEWCERYYTIDHFIPLALGGSNDPSNLWPEHKKVKATRQSLEIDLYRDLAAGNMTQQEAIETVVDAKTNAPAIPIPECPHP